MTWFEKARADIANIRDDCCGDFQKIDDLESMVTDLATRLDKLEARIRRNDSRGIDCDVRDELIAILEADTSA